MRQIDAVLVVEDQKWTTFAIKDGLRECFVELKLSPEVTYITNFNEALATIRSDKEFDIILLDHRIPRVDQGDLEDRDFDAFCRTLDNVGYSLIPEIKERHPDTFIIGTSSMGSELRTYPHKPDASINKLDMSSPEREFTPLLRKWIENDVIP